VQLVTGFAVSANEPPATARDQVQITEAAMAKKAKRRFPPKALAAIDQGNIIGLRAGREQHRFIGIWVVVVEGRVFVRSWSLKPRSWWRTFGGPARRRSSRRS